MPVPHEECTHCRKRRYLRWRDAVIDARRLNREQPPGMHVEPYISRECGGVIHIGGSPNGRVYRHDPRTKRQRRTFWKRRERTRRKSQKPRD